LQMHFCPGHCAARGVLPRGDVPCGPRIVEIMTGDGGEAVKQVDTGAGLQRYVEVLIRVSMISR
jgi:hypothetical protein